MLISRRSVVGAGTGLALAHVAEGADAASPRSTEPDARSAAELIRETAEANAALMRGDAQTYRDLVRITDDFTLMSPFGGTPTHGTGFTDEKWDGIGRFFRNGTFEQEVVQSYSSPGMVVLVVVERAHVEVGGLPPQDWSLRVTLAYRRDGSEWRLVHRHADPLVKGISLEQAAILAGDAV